MWSVRGLPRARSDDRCASRRCSSSGWACSRRQPARRRHGQRQRRDSSSPRGRRASPVSTSPRICWTWPAGRALEAGVDVRFIEGDAEELPFESDSFDRVTSCFGVIFAPRHEHAASELARVARPGATVAFTAWTPEGLNGQMFRTIGSYMPPPPPQVRIAAALGRGGVRALAARRHAAPRCRSSGARSPSRTIRPRAGSSTTNAFWARRSWRRRRSSRRAAGSRAGRS